MQATIPRSFRRAAAPLLAVLLVGCQTTPDSGGVRDVAPEERATQASARGDHAAAARAWEQAAARGEQPARNAARLQGARAWLAAGDPAGVERNLAALKPPLAAGEDLERARLQAEVALLRREPAKALALLKDAPAGASPALLETRARALFASNRAVDGTRALIARELSVTEPAAIAAGRRLLAVELRKAARANADLKAPANADALLAGWLAFGRTLAVVERNPLQARSELMQFRARFSGHPAGAEPVRELLQEYAARGEYPGQVALLLPLSGRAGVQGGAVRDGFLAAYYQLDTGVRPRVRLYDTAAQDVPGAYLAAVTEGADFVVGPLTREEVAAVAQVADGRVDVLALNFTADGAATPRRFFQFALSPEDEARAAARRALTDGRRRAAALVPNNEWGRRVVAAFREEYEGRGGQIVDQRLYPPGTTDFADDIESLLRITRVTVAPSAPADPGAPPAKPQYAYQVRPDIDCLFMPAQPTQGRLLRPQVKFHRAGALPAYATSEIYEPSGAANSDLDGVMFPDMPWLVDTGAQLGPLGTIRRLWGTRANRHGRLFAMGYDAFRLVGELNDARTPLPQPLSGATGRLSLDGERRVRRELDWVQIRGGQPVPLPPATP
jgi:outer membrane PBP1 activator LpoA protein